MAEPTTPPAPEQPDKKPAEELPGKPISENEQAIEDLSWDIPFFRTVWNFFVREGQAVKNGWLAVLIMVGISVFVTRDCSREKMDEKIAEAKKEYENKSSELSGELIDAKRDRDKFQMMLAPFEAYALAKYTNAPLDDRLALLGATMNLITNELAIDRPVLHVEINGQKLKGSESPKIGQHLDANIIPLGEDRHIAIKVFCDSEVSAQNATIKFYAQDDSSKILVSQWKLALGQPIPDWNTWNLMCDQSIIGGGGWDTETILVSTNLTEPQFSGHIKIFADRSKTWAYGILFVFQNNKGVTNIVDRP